MTAVVGAGGASARGRARGVVGVRALRPNAEWPPEDVWEDFVAAHAGEYAGAAATFDGKTGRAMPLPERYVPDAFKEYGVDVMEWQIVTRGAMTNDGDGLRLETSLACIRKPGASTGRATSR